jgi:hypothetical protein
MSARLPPSAKSDSIDIVSRIRGSTRRPDNKRKEHSEAFLASTTAPPKKEKTSSIDDADLDAVAAARAAARAVAWAQRAEQTGNALPACLVAGVPLLDDAGRPVLVIDDDATIVITHSEKERPVPHAESDATDVRRSSPTSWLAQLTRVQLVAQ